MYDIKLLEDEWKRYKRKKRWPWYLSLFFILLIVAISLTVLNYKENNLFEYEFNLSSTLKSEPSVKTTQFITDGALTSLETKQETFREMTKLTDSSLDDETSEHSESFPLSEKTETVERPKINIEVVETNSVSAYADVANRFHQSHDTDDSLFLANSYYRKGDYKKSEYWALQTNKVNGSIEESWLLFARSKLKQGERKEAIRILNAYIKKTNSVEAKKLLNKIKKGLL